MKQHAIMKSAVLASSALILSGASGLFAGEPAPYVPAPVPAPECGNPGWTFTAAALYLRSYGASSNNVAQFDEDSDSSGDWDWGFRGSVSYERPDGLFFRLVGFWYEADSEFTLGGEGSQDFTGKTKTYAFDLLVGDTFCPTDNLTLEVAAGLRYAKLESDLGWREQDSGPSTDGGWSETWGDQWDNEFEGWGPTVQIRARRSLTDRISLYADFQQSLLFGDNDQSYTSISRGTSDGVDWNEDETTKATSDSLAAISEIRGGIEFGWGWNRIQNAYLRLGAEGQYWWTESFDLGLVGGVAEVGFVF